MMKKGLFLSAIVFMAFSTLLSCNNDDFSTPDTTNIVTFGGAISRVTDNAFDNDDEISVVAFDSDGALFGDAASYTYSNGGFTSSSPILLPDGGSLSYFASYTAQQGIEESFTFAIQTDQDSDDGYEQSDLLIAKVAESNSTNPTLQFAHTMSNLEVTINVVENGVAVTGAEVSSISFWALNNVSCDIANSTYQGTGSTSEITPLEVTADAKYSLILAPQTIATSSSSSFASITIGETTYTWSPSSNIVFESGYKYEYTWTIDQTLKTSQVTFTGDITSWESGTIIDDDDSDSSSNNESGSGNDNESGSETTTTTTLSSSNFSSSVTDQTITVDGIEFRTNYYSSNGYINAGGDSNSYYLYNTTAISGLKEVVIKYYTSSISICSFFSGESENPSTNDYTPNISSKTYTYTIQSGSYISIKPTDSTTIASITFTYESKN